MALLRWPAQDGHRRWLAARRQPRLLLVPPGTPPPDLLDDLEDWLREPADAGDRAARVRDLARRALPAPVTVPEVDGDGLLRHDGRWVAIPDGQLPVVRLLVDRVGRVVGLDLLRAPYEAAGGSGHPDSIRTLVARLARRVRQVGLRLDTVRGRGVILDVVPRR